MITNLPDYKDFENLAKQCLIQSFNHLFKIYENFTEYRDADEIIRDEVSSEDIWLHNLGTIRTSIILIYQAIETSMKSAVCKTTPLLLIEKSKLDWPTLPNKEDKDFDTLYTISGESLLNTYAAVVNEPLSNEIINFIDEVRVLRNRAIHGVANINIGIKQLLEYVLKTYTIFYGKDTWFNDLKEFNLSNPLFGYFDWDVENISSYKFLDFALAILNKKTLNKYLTIDILGRGYYCEHCKEIFDGDYGYLESKWAFLIPNNPTSTKVKCINCNTDIEVIREDCKNSTCKGNVITKDTEVCLTCFDFKSNYSS